ncbi:MAG: response regulator [Candidatus Scalindua sp.]
MANSETEKKTILLVEDNPDDVELTLLGLKKNNVVNDIVVAQDGAEALDYLFCTGKYAERDAGVMPVLILLDLKLPKVDGHEVLNRLRSDDRTKIIPVVVLTTSDEETDMVRSYNGGANSYIRKPVDFIRFSEAIQQLKVYWLLLNETPPNPAS